MNDFNDLDISDRAASVILFGIILVLSYMVCAFIGASFDPFVWPAVVRLALLVLFFGNAYFAFGDLRE